MTLPSNITRCHDAWCASRLRCIRYTERYHAPDGRVSHADSLLVSGADGTCVHLLTEMPIGAWVRT
jgi:hypothetical protein